MLPPRPAHALRGLADRGRPMAMEPGNAEFLMPAAALPHPQRERRPRRRNRTRLTTREIPPSPSRRPETRKFSVAVTRAGGAWTGHASATTHAIHRVKRSPVSNFTRRQALFPGRPQTADGATGSASLGGARRGSTDALVARLQLALQTAIRLRDIWIIHAQDFQNIGSCRLRQHPFG